MSIARKASSPGRWLVSDLPGICNVYVIARELCSACTGWLDPCLRSDVRPCLPLHVLPERLKSLGLLFGFLCCIPTITVIASPIVPFPPCVAVGDAGWTSKRPPCSTLLTPSRVWQTWRTGDRSISRTRHTDWAWGLDPSLSEQAFVAHCVRLSLSFRDVFPEGSTSLERHRSRKGMLPG